LTVLYGILIVAFTLGHQSETLVSLSSPTMTSSYIAKQLLLQILSPSQTK